MTCTLITYEEAMRLQHRDVMWRQARAEMVQARRDRTCVWCDDPIAPHREYPACEECRTYRGVEAP